MNVVTRVINHMARTTKFNTHETLPKIIIYKDICYFDNFEQLFTVFTFP